MTSLYDIYTTNVEEVDLIFGDATITIKRAGTSNKEYVDAVRKLNKKYGRSIDAGAISPEVADRLLAEIFAETVITGWKGVTGPDGKPISFGKANVVKLLTDLPDFFKEIRDAAEDRANFRKEQREDDAKN